METLVVPLVHGGYDELRAPGLDGTGKISLRDLVKFVLPNFEQTAVRSPR